MTAGKPDRGARPNTANADLGHTVLSPGPTESSQSWGEVVSITYTPIFINETGSRGKGNVLVTQSYPTVGDPMDCSPPGSSVHGVSPGKNTGEGCCHELLQGIFPAQGSNLGLPHCRWILYHLSHQGSPRILEWIADPFSRGTSHPRNRTGVSSTAGRFFTN